MSKIMIMIEVDGITLPEAEELAEQIISHNENIYDLNIQFIKAED